MTDITLVALIVSLSIGLVEIIKTLINKTLPSFHEKAIIHNLDNMARIQQRSLEILIKLETRINGHD